MMMNWRIAAAVAAAAVVVYLPFLGLPFISDDYTQIRLAREYGAPAGWADLAADPLYRSRATSLLVTHWIDSTFGLQPLAHNLASLALHLVNCLLVALLGLWRRVGFAVSAPAALFFAVYEGHQEAVIWNAALHELLVFAFVLGCCLNWILWLQEGCRDWWRGALAAACFVLALFSKESAVAVLPVLGLLWWLERPASWAPLAHLGGYTALAGFYAAGIFGAAATHQHLNDGTFDWRAPFWLTLPHSLGRMLWIWGLAALVYLWARRDGGAGRLAGFGLVWMAVALLPYSFLMYQNRVPSRHTYLAAAGLALVAGAAWRALSPGRGTAAVLVVVLLAHNGGYLWLRKLPQYERRAATTSRFLEFAAQREGPVRVRCTPYDPAVLADAAAVALGWPREAVVNAAGNHSEGDEYCDLDHP